MNCMNFLLMIGVAPFSWRFGLIRHTAAKAVFALGPFRVSLHDLDMADSLAQNPEGPNP